MLVAIIVLKDTNNNLIVSIKQRDLCIILEDKISAMRFEYDYCSHKKQLTEAKLTFSDNLHQQDAIIERDYNQSHKEQASEQASIILKRHRSKELKVEIGCLQAELT